MAGSAEEIHIGALDVAGCMIFALDLNYLIPAEQATATVSARVAGDWLRSVHARLVDWEAHGYRRPRFAESEYGKTDRGARNTFTTRYRDQLLPLELELVNPPSVVQYSFTYCIEGLRISPQGALSLRVVAHTEPGRILTAKTVVHDYHSLLGAVPELLERHVTQFVDFWNSCIDELNLVVPSRKNLIAALHSYDIWDFDFVLEQNGQQAEVTSVKELYTLECTTPLQELTAIANMDVADVESLRDVRLTHFTDSDIGTRDDELWVIGRERMTRRHPERRIIYNIAFFTDIKLAAEIMVGYQCTLDFLEDWVRSQRRSLLDRILRFDDLGDVSKRDLQKRYSDVIRVSQILVEPLALERGAKHAFFAEAVVKLAESLELSSTMEKSSRAMGEFTRLVESISAFRDAELNGRLGSLQLDLARSARVVGIMGVILAILGIMIAGLQTYISLK
jgi:hypothetical protein